MMQIQKMPSAKQVQTLVKSFRQKHNHQASITPFAKQLLALNPAKNDRQFNQIINTLQNMTWYNADVSMVHLLVMALSLIDNDPKHRQLKQLVRQYKIEFEQEDNYEHAKAYRKIHGTYDGYVSYSFVANPKILPILWTHPEIRQILSDWLNVYRKYKRKYGLEIPSQIHRDATKIKKVVQLLNGITNNDHITLHPYLRNPTQVLTYQQWCEKLIHADNVLGVISLWD